MTQELAREFEEALVTLDRDAAQRALVACGDGDVVADIVVPALDSIGARWDAGELALSQVYMGGRLCEGLVMSLLPKALPGRADQPRIAIGTLEDHHLLGKRIVHSALRASGYEVLDYGRLTVESAAARVASDGVRILLLSVLMFPSALRVKEVKRALPPGVKLVVGGAPFRFDAQLGAQVGADVVGRTASEAVSIVASLVAQLAAAEQESP